MKEPRLRLMHADKVISATVVTRVAVAIATTVTIAVRAAIEMTETTEVLVTIETFNVISTIKMVAIEIAIADDAVDLVDFEICAMTAHKAKIAMS
jgi:hypothetical protein